MHSSSASPPDQRGRQTPRRCLLEFTTGDILKPGYDFGAEFEFGLNLILDGKTSIRERNGKRSA